MPRIARTLDEYKELLTKVAYNPITGIFIWTSGRVAGSNTLEGYRRIIYLGKPFYAHRVAYVAMTGVVAELIDHIDRNRSNNIWTNLRATDDTVNRYNSDPSTANTSGYTGVSFFKRVGKWQGYLTHKGKRISCGHHYTAEQAHIAASSKREEILNERRTKSTTQHTQQ